MFKISKYIVVATLVLLQGCANWSKMGDQEKSMRKFLAPGTLGLSLILPSDNAKNKCETPHCQVNGTLPWAAEMGRSRKIRELLANGADVNQEGAFGRTPLRLATQNRKYDAVVILLTASPSQYEKNYALSIASAMGSLDLVRLLLKHGASPNVMNDNHNTALMTAAEYNKWQVMEMLLNTGADVTLRNSFGRTAFDYAKGCEKCLEILQNNQSN